MVNNYDRFSMPLLKRLYGMLKGYFVFTIIAVVAAALTSSLDSFMIWSLKPIINHGLVKHNVNFIAFLPYCALAAVSLRASMTFMSGYFSAYVSNHFVLDCRRALVAKYLYLPTSYFDQHNSSAMLSKILYNVGQVANVSSTVLVGFARDGFYALGCLVVMFVIDWRASLCFVVIVPLIAWVFKVSARKVRVRSGASQHYMAESTQVIQEAVRANTLVKLGVVQANEQQKYHHVSQSTYHQQMKIAKAKNIATSSIQLLLSIPILMLLYFSFHHSSHSSAGGFAVLATTMLAIIGPFQRLSSTNVTLMRGLTALGSIFEVLDLEEEENAGVVTTDRVSGRVEFDNVSYQYEGASKQVLQHVNLVAPVHKTIALVGFSGGGKSTLVNLIPRFYNPTQGRILLDGVDIATMELNFLRNQISLVSQETILFDDSVYNNIAYGRNGEVSEQEVVQAVKAAAAYDFIQALPQSFETRIGEGGVLLSGGQRQRIAIARAFLKKAPILIFDEATSALDNESEMIIQQAFLKLAANRTTFVIAHRLSTIVNADQIVVMDDGCIIEQGNHQQLLTKKGVYANLYALQSRNVELETLI
jgi:ATP-binding cassette, subfamily B, bacterial MsbA